MDESDEEDDEEDEADEDFVRNDVQSTSLLETVAKLTIPAYSPVEDDDEDDVQSGNNSSTEMAQPIHPSGISWHERRCWNVFFTTFKHQSRTESSFAWCWFALQLDKLRKDLVRTRNQTALSRLEQWMDSVHTKMSILAQDTIKTCVFSPQLCAGCSAAALSSKKKSSSSSSSSALVVDPLPSSEKVPMFFNPLQHPFIEFEMDSKSARIVQMNDLFISRFGYTKPFLEQTLKWSGGGNFLPWGGDLAAILLWSEADLLIFLQVLAVKFQASGPLIHDHDDPTHVQTRELLSAFMFDVRLAPSKGDNGLVMPCMIKSLHRETLNGLELKMTVLLEFQVMGAPTAGPDLPKSSKEALDAVLQRKGTYEDFRVTTTNNQTTESDFIVPQPPPPQQQQSSSSSAADSNAIPPDYLDALILGDRELLDPTWNWSTLESMISPPATTAIASTSVTTPSSATAAPTYEEDLVASEDLFSNNGGAAAAQEQLARPGPIQRSISVDNELTGEWPLDFWLNGVLELL
jgi:hypothetical protein